MDVGGLALLGKLFEERRARLLALIDRRLSSVLRGRLSPEDVLSEVYIRARQRWDDFRQFYRATAEPPYDSWLNRLVRDCLVDLYRHHTAKKGDVRQDVALADGSGSQILQNLVSPTTGASGKVARDEMAKRLAEVIALLKDSERKLLGLRYDHNRSWEEIAKELGLSAGNVRVKHVRALRRLKDLWKERFGSEGFPS